MEEAGLPCPIVSCGGTGSYRFAAAQPGITEIQAGGAIFMDNFYRDVCQVDEFELALTVLTTVCEPGRHPSERSSTPDASRCIPKTARPPSSTGPICTSSACRPEHGQLLVDPEEQSSLKIGDRLQLVPGYGDLTTVLHDQFFGVRDGKLEAIWPLHARGCLT